MSQNTKFNIDTASISYYDHYSIIYSDVFFNIKTIVDIIKSSKKLKLLVQQIRDEKDPTKQTELKSHLPAVTFQGRFRQRNDKGLKKPSGLAIMDFDNTSTLSQVYDQLIVNKYTVLLFKSPRDKYKAVMRIPEVKDAKEYKEIYKALLEEFKHLKPDPSNSNLSRLCFLSYDPNIYYNPNAEIFNKRIEFVIPKTKANVINTLSENNIIDRVYSYWRKYHYTSDQRNNPLFILACSLSEYGIQKGVTESMLMQFAQPFATEPFPETEILKLINSAYNRTQFNSKIFS